MNLHQRQSGVLLPLSSVPGNAFCGGLGAGAFRFVDFLADAGQRIWQMLPINPIDDCHSPYASISSFAAEPLYIDLVDLANEGLLDQSDLDSLPPSPPGHCDYQAAIQYRTPLLRKAFRQFFDNEKPSRRTKYHDTFEQFISKHYWAEHHAIFCALSEKYDTSDWSLWPDEAIRHADEHALHSVRNELHESISYHLFLQVVFDIQWQELKNYCRERNVALIGDVPIYVSKRSVDTWSASWLFQMTKDGAMTRVAGVPGDNFNPDGQRWDAPLYNWEEHKRFNYHWWLDRLSTTLHRFDAVRLDHFIGFFNYFSMPPEKSEDDPGRWEPGPADDFFDAVLREFPQAQLIAEDLGVMKQGVHDLRDKYGFPGINVFQFFFDHRRDTDPTVEWKVNSLVCSGTHDTDTLASWCELIYADAERIERGEVPFWNLKYLREMLAPYTPTNEPDPKRSFALSIIRKTMSSPGNVAIFPMQDILVLPTEARINFPGHIEHNWFWRLSDSALTNDLAAALAAWTMEFGRDT